MVGSLGGVVAQRGRGDSTEATPPRRFNIAPARVKEKCFLVVFAFTFRKQISEQRYDKGTHTLSGGLHVPIEHDLLEGAVFRL